MSRPCSVRKRHRFARPAPAFTLIEVLVGLFLLSSLIVSGLYGMRLHQQKLRFNQHRVEAIAMVEPLLFQWARNPEVGMPIGGQGIIDPQRQWFWRTVLVGARQVFGRNTWIVRLEIVENSPVPNTVLVSVDLLKAAPEIVAPLAPTMPALPESPEPVPEEPQL